MIKAIIFDCFGVVFTQQYGARNDYLNRNLLEYIKKLKPNYKTALLSNVKQAFVDELFKSKEAQEEYFDKAFTSEALGITKPHQDAYILASKQLGVEPGYCVFIDDSAQNCEGAEAVGMRAIVYTDFESFKNELNTLLRAESL